MLIIYSYLRIVTDLMLWKLKWVLVIVGLANNFVLVLPVNWKLFQNKDYVVVFTGQH